ncbi:DNA-processing protein DprA [Aestuariibius sp. 2305UL40-4]|uniref:DNA-processing protein DprA n=1 Tax=Aestuariibius violaceus TaxID=3234132 RepID=UPI00345E7A14
MTEARTSSAETHDPSTQKGSDLDWLRLLRSRRVGVSTFFRLLAEHGSARAALAELPAIARAAGIDDYAPCPTAVAQTELKAGQSARATLIRWDSGAYPAALREIDDPPPLLWAVGRVDLLNAPGKIALVGARNASSLGTRMAASLAGKLGAEGKIIVSGLARGIDTAAHNAALDTGTIAVVAGGVDICYPAENMNLFDGIQHKGLILSEQPMGLQPQARHFPRRNRIISGLSQAVVVVEAAAKSGSLITARTALDQGREVLAVPGHPFDARAAGCNMLIRDGARLVRGPADILESLTPEQPLAEQLPLPDPTPPKRTLRETAAIHSQILARLGPSPVAEDQLIRDLSGPAQEVTPALVDLELDGKIQRHPGGLLSRP